MTPTFRRLFVTFVYCHFYTAPYFLKPDVKKQQKSYLKDESSILSKAFLKLNITSLSQRVKLIK